MTNPIKITQMVPASLPLAPTDLIEVVQGVGGFPVSRAAAIGDLPGGLDGFVFEAALTLQNCPVGWNIISLQAPFTDPKGAWASGQPARITVQPGGAGWYLMIAHVNIEVGNGDAVVAFSVNSTTPGSTDNFSFDRGIINSPRDIRTTHLRRLAVGDFVSVHFFQNTGATRTLGNRSNVKMIRLFPT